MHNISTYKGECTLYLPPLDLGGYNKIEASYYNINSNGDNVISIEYKITGKRKINSFNLPDGAIFIILKDINHPEVEGQYKITTHETYIVHEAMFPAFSEDLTENFISFINKYIYQTNPIILFNDSSKISNRKIEFFTETANTAKILVEDSNSQDIFLEGSARDYLTNTYERNHAARLRCIEHYGATCVICGFNFGEIYGDLVRNFIHVHHIIPLSHINQEYQVDPIKDLRPVCPNCHSVVHSRNPPFSIDEVKNMLKSTF